MCTARSEFRTRLLLPANYSEITLGGLSAGDVRTMVGQLTSANLLRGAVIAAIVQRTEGVPLFVEELTRAVLETGNAKLSSPEIPATLQ
jgi:predicted ATPase